MPSSPETDGPNITRFTDFRGRYFAVKFLGYDQYVPVRGLLPFSNPHKSYQYQTSHGHQNRRERVNKIWISFLVKIRLYRPSKILERPLRVPIENYWLFFGFFLIPKECWGVEYLKDLCQKFFMRFDIHLVDHLR